MSVVLDASMALNWLLPETDDPRAQVALDEVLADGAIASPLFDLEVGNILVVKERRGDLDRRQVMEALELLYSFPLEPLEVDPDIREVVGLARQHDLTVYDASYLWCARKLGLPLATLDKALRQAANREGVVLIA